MYLAPHHFQTQSRFFEDSIQFVSDCFWQFNYGILALDIDESELRHGSFVLHNVRGVMPDGLVFRLAEPDELPPPLPVADIFPHTGQPLMLFLAVPSYQEGRQNVLVGAEAGAAGTARFRSSRVAVPDYNTGQDPKPVELLLQNLRIATEHELTPDDVSLPLARILRDGKGQYVEDPAYVPPCLQVASSARLQFLLDRLLEILSDKSRNLSARRRRTGAMAPRGDPKELVEFWLLHSVNSAIPILRLWKTGKSPHPAQLFVALSQLAGSLCTFASNSEPASLPAYDHMALGDCFAALDDHIQRHLELGLPTNCITIPLVRFQNLFFRGAVEDMRCFGKARWILGIKADVPETSLISHVPELVKVSTQDWIERLVRQALPGAPLRYLPMPPAPVPAQFGMVYFSIDQDHRLFDPIRTHKNLGIYVHGDLVNPEVELHVVLGDVRA
jgi:type VI secretion system protein ImpJ